MSFGLVSNQDTGTLVVDMDHLFEIFVTKYMNLEEDIQTTIKEMKFN